MERYLEKIVVGPFKAFVERLLTFLPNLLTSLVLIGAGLLIAWLAKVAVVKAAQFLKMDKLSERAGMKLMLERGGIKDPLPRLLGRIAYWLVVITFVIMGLNALSVPAVEELFERFFLYLPNVVMAAVVMVIGYTVGNFLGRAALIASVNAGLRISGLVGRLVKVTVFFISLTMALELLGIGEDTVLVAFTIVFGGLVLALSIAFGLGGKDAAKEYIEKIREKEEKDEIEHI